MINLDSIITSPRSLFKKKLNQIFNYFSQNFILTFSRTPKEL